ncbi:MAG: dipeptide epimerase [Verrucomicrobia bacterium]|jgi:L-Ala-D/L-Glu epimerase|nr:MAG: dipeptide epimerase [Verrucomicrobiota bacterium]
MHLRFHPYTLELRHRFTLATSSRTSTPSILTEVEQDGIVGYGEASMPPYLGENVETASQFLNQVKLPDITSITDIPDILRKVDLITLGNTAAKASVDIALHDWIGKVEMKPLYTLWGLNPTLNPFTSFTIGIDTPEIIIEKTKQAIEFKILKVKLGSLDDKEIIQAIRSVSKQPLFIDANQGWTNKEQALRMIEWLADQNVLLIEQPMPKSQKEDMAWLKERSSLPLIADESVQRLSDIKAAAALFHGINIKLMKCTGLNEARAMITEARNLGLKIMLGCMTETSCAISAAAQIASLVDWCDLDGALLIKNDPFKGAYLNNGSIIATDLPGLGLVKV